MKKVYQDIDNCIDACVASILEIPLKSIPNIRHMATNNRWTASLNEWALKKHKTMFIRLSFEDLEHLIYDAYNGYVILSIIGDLTPREGHAVVAKISDERIKIVHDPMGPKCMGDVGLNRKVSFALVPIKLC